MTESDVDDASQKGPSDNEDPLELAARRWAELRERAKQRVRNPAEMLQFGGAVMVALAIIYLVTLVAMMMTEEFSPGILVLLYIVMAFVLGPIIWIGGQRMVQLRSYRWAMTATVLLLFPGILFCFVFALVAIRSFFVLVDFDIQTAFQKSGLPEEYDALT